MLITKVTGETEFFDDKKLRDSLLNAGASANHVEMIVDQVSQNLEDGASSKGIYKMAFKMLKKFSNHVAARYSLKNAIMDLGPSGYPFELYVAELFKHYGFQVQVGVVMQGHCIKHEVDVLADKDSVRHLIECKYHNHPSYLSNVRIPLYIHSRFNDIVRYHKDKNYSPAAKFQGWIVTNTRFSDDAEAYGKCAGIKMISWDYPKNHGLKDWIDRAGLHPVTSLTTLTKYEKQLLLEKKFVLSRTIIEKPDILERIGIKPPRTNKILTECNQLCLSTKLSRNASNLS